MDCKIYGCIRPVFRQEMCVKHYEEDRKKNAPICSIDGCEKTSSRRGMCEQHYRSKLREESSPCSVDGCGRPSVSHSLCEGHYRRLKKHGDLSATRPSDWGGRKTHPLYKMWCARRSEGRRPMCEEWKNDFWKFVKDVGEKPIKESQLRALDYSKPIGPENFFWREPMNNSQRRKYMKQYQKEWSRRVREKNPDYWRRYDFHKNSYGISYDDYLQMSKKQDDKCAICGSAETAKNPKTGKPRRLAVDHCHKTGKVRSLLCTHCNSGLGKFKDDSSLLRLAIAYLEKHKD